MLSHWPIPFDQGWHRSPHAWERESRERAIPFSPYSPTHLKEFLRPLTVFRNDCLINCAKEHFGTAATSEPGSTGPQASRSVSQCCGLALGCCDSHLSLQRNVCIRAFPQGCFSLTHRQLQGANKPCRRQIDNMESEMGWQPEGMWLALFPHLERAAWGQWSLRCHGGHLLETLPSGSIYAASCTSSPHFCSVWFQWSPLPAQGGYGTQACSAKVKHSLSASIMRQVDA